MDDLKNPDNNDTESTEPKSNQYHKSAPIEPTVSEVGEFNSDTFSEEMPTIHVNPDGSVGHSNAFTPTPSSTSSVLPTAAEHPHNSAGIIVLQWLTYAFWGWTLLAANWLIYTVISSLISGADVSSFIPYAIAATLVLLPISVICDLLYGKREPAKKTGGAMVVMVIHAVIFALFGIGSLIAAVLIVVQLLIQTPTDMESTISWLVSFLVGAVLYGFTFLRTLNPSPKLKLPKIYTFAMLIIIIVFTILAFVGPVAKSIATRDDRDIVAGLPYVGTAIEDYVGSNNKLPATLSDVTINDQQGKAIVQKSLVSYKPEGKSLAADADVDSSMGSLYDYKYQLCVTYKEKGGDGYPSPDSKSSEYSSSAYVYDHPAGQACYKVKATIRETTTALSDSLFKQ